MNDRHWPGRNLAASGCMKRILIADDSERMRRIIRQVVSGFASEVYEARDGREAVALYTFERPDWVLMDLRMKPVDGLLATAEIKARFPEARIIIVSQHDDPALQAEATRLGACAYVLKENLHELPKIITGIGTETLSSRSPLDYQRPSSAGPENNLPRKASP